jgi:hypothetical protein
LAKEGVDRTSGRTEECGLSGLRIEIESIKASIKICLERVFERKVLQ